MSATRRRLRRAIVADVRERGDAALLEWTERFDGPRPSGFRVPARRSRPRRSTTEVLDALRQMIAAVRAFSEAAAPAPTRPSRRSRASSPNGAGSRRLRWHLRARAVASPLPSSLVMTAVPAQVAGVRRLAVDDPASGRGDPRRRARARHRRDLRGRRRAGVAALAFGTESIRRGGQDRRARATRM